MPIPLVEVVVESVVAEPGIVTGPGTVTEQMVVSAPVVYIR